MSSLVEPRQWLELYQTNFVHLREIRKRQLKDEYPNSNSDDDEHDNESSSDAEEVESKINILSLPEEVLSSVFSRLEAEQLSCLAQVSSRFLCHAYDSRHWRRIALKTWPHESLHVLEKRLWDYKSWRKLCTLRPRLRANAIYVTRHRFTKTTCRVAVSEPLAPVFLVEYYRFLRFYPDGTVVSLTTPEPPEISYRRLRRTWTPGWNDRDKAYPSVGNYELDEESEVVTVSLPMSQPRFPSMRNGTMYMHFKLTHSAPGACDTLHLTDHFAIMDNDGGELISYPRNSCGETPFKLVSIWGFRHKVYDLFPKDDQKDLAQWYEMKRAARALKRKD